MLNRYLVIMLSCVAVSCGGGGGTSTPTPQPDTTSPVISLQGDSLIAVEVGTVFEDPGATATDNIDGPVAVSQSGTVSDEQGTYTITYTASDSAGNTSSLNRTVVVEEAPSITQFSFLKANNPSLSEDIDLSLEEGVISGRVGVGVNNLIATIVHDGAEINVEGISQTSGLTGNDFTHPLSYTLATASGLEKTYTVDITQFTGLPIIYLTTNNDAVIDKSLLRNTIVFEMGYISSLDWTPASTFAEVFLNGEYNGVYNITQKVEESSTRVDLGDDGYLLEIDNIDRIDADDVYITTDQFEIINIKEPDLAWNDAKYAYIDNLINQFELNLFGGDFADPVNGYAKFIDVDSFIDWFLINEIVKNVDSKNFSSIYLNVIPGEKIKMGPLWDFDLGFGNVDYADPEHFEGFWVRWNPWIDRLLQDPAFVDKVRTRFAYFKDNEDYILGKIDQYAEKLKWSQKENNDKWELFGEYVWPNPVYFDTHAEEVAHLKSWYQSRMDWLETALNTL